MSRNIIVKAVLLLGTTSRNKHIVMLQPLSPIYHNRFMHCHWKAPVGHGFLAELRPFHVKNGMMAPRIIFGKNENAGKDNPVRFIKE